MIKKLLNLLLKLLFPGLYKNKKNKINTSVTYHKKSFLTNYEKTFFTKLKEIEKYGNYIVHPQINLATIVHKKSNQKYNSELFRNIDFAIFNNNYELLLLIELNDSTHNETKRKIRDAKVKKICEEANIKLITFYTKYPNEKEYIINRVLKEIQS